MLLASPIDLGHALSSHCEINDQRPEPTRHERATPRGHEAIGVGPRITRIGKLLINAIISECAVDRGSSTVRPTTTGKNP
jgi:hypothetical protein